MRYKVKVGQEFSCIEVDEQITSVTVYISQQPSVTPAGSEPIIQRRVHRAPWRELLMGFALLLFLGAPVAYAALTGDFTELRSIAQLSGDLLRTVINLLKPS